METGKCVNDFPMPLNTSFFEVVFYYSELRNEKTGAKMKNS